MRGQVVKKGQSRGPASRKNAMRLASFKLPGSLSSSLERIAHQKGTSKSQVARDALERYVNSLGGVPPGSFLDRAKKYIGCVDGPGDLSFNKEHMHGFGE